MTAMVSSGYPPSPEPMSDGSAHKLSRHPILEKGVFEQLQRNDVVEARPSVLHFGGFQIHKQHTHRLRIINTAPTSLRVTIIGPSTPYFKINYDKKGLLAPGMGEEITVIFEPHEWRYYYDTVKIFCGEMSENLVIPIHAYPSANDIQLPRIVDFGSVAIGTSRTKVIPLTCKIPISFEFEIEVLENHPDFEVTPMAGIIPADAGTNVVVTFLPTKFRTSRMELRFNISQFDFEPVVVTVVGSSAPDISHGEVLQNAQAELVASAKQGLQETMTNKVKSLKNKRGRGPLQALPAQFAQDVTEKIIDGVKVPVDFHQQSTNFVLNQTAGKMPLKDLFGFIMKQREAAERRRRRAEAEHRGEKVDDDGDDEDNDIQALELRFELQYRDVAKYDKDKDLNSRPAIGEDQIEEENVEKFDKARAQKHDSLLQESLEADTRRADSVMKESMPVGVPNSYIHKLRPQWDLNANNMFAMRLQVIDRFVRAGSKALMRMRVEKAAAKLRETLRDAGVADRASCRAWIESENKAAAAGGPSTKKAPEDDVDTKGKTTGMSEAAAAVDDLLADIVEVVRIPLDFVLPVQIPISGSSNAAEDRQPVEVMPLDNFEEFPPAELKPRLDYRVHNYKVEHVLPPSAAYMRPNNGRLSRVSAALEEMSIRGPCGDFFDGAEQPICMPDTCMLPPAHEALSLLIPSPECRTFVSFPDFTECDTEYRLALLPDFIPHLETDTLLPRDIQSLDTPWLAAYRPNRQLQDSFAVFDPLPSCYAEAGGSHGPRLGFDAGGERLSFLPVDGFARDLPSDTDDDDREDFEKCEHTQPPEQVAYDAAVASLSLPLVSERWRKEQEAEDRLVKLCEENSCAARERLRELNKDLSHRHKLYLG